MLHIEKTIYTALDGTSFIVLTLSGCLDVKTASSFRLQLKQCISQVSPHVVVNLKKVSFIDSSGLTCLVSGMLEADKMKGSFHICNVQPVASLVIEATMMDSVLKIYDDCSKCFCDIGLSTNNLALADRASEKHIPLSPDDQAWLDAEMLLVSESASLLQ